MKKVLTMGNALVDMLIRIKDDAILEKLGFARGSMTLVDKDSMNNVLKLTEGIERSQSTGGSAANTINGLARLGVPTGYIGKVGKDEYGEFFNADLVRNSIVSTLFKGTQETGKSVILISSDSERTMATYLGAAVELEPGDLKPEFFEGYDYFHLEGYLVQNHELVKRAVELSKQAGNKITIDLSSFNVVEDNLDFLTPLVKDYIDVVFANEDEAKAFTGKEDPEEALNEIAKVCSLAVVKIGSEGSLIKEGDKVFKVKPINAISLDTTGAGDLYASGFFYGLANNCPLDVCGQFGSITAGKVVEIIGAKMPEDHWKLVTEMIDRVNVK